ncbi:zinc finger MYM-type protein 1-like, partial [Aphis craccivora]
KVEELHDTIGLLEAIYAFQTSSTLRYQVFFDKTGSKSMEAAEAKGLLIQMNSLKLLQQNSTIAVVQNWSNPLWNN